MTLLQLKMSPCFTRLNFYHKRKKKNTSEVWMVTLSKSSYHSITSLTGNIFQSCWWELASCVLLTLTHTAVYFLFFVHDILFSLMMILFDIWSHCSNMRQKQSHLSLQISLLHLIRLQLTGQVTSYRLQVVKYWLCQKSWDPSNPVWVIIVCTHTYTHTHTHTHTNTHTHKHTHTQTHTHTNSCIHT